jgi:hypothetical protein
MLFFRFTLQILMVILQAGLTVWVMCAPIVWIVRDGLGPDSRETGWGLGILKFAVEWSVPALVLALPLYGLARLNRRLGAMSKRPSRPGEVG